jgi:hypothetical protein
MITEYPNFLDKNKFNALVKKITASERWAFTGKSTNQSKPSFWYLEMYDDQKLVSIINDGMGSAEGGIVILPMKVITPCSYIVTMNGKQNGVDLLFFKQAILNNKLSYHYKIKQCFFNPIYCT